MDRKFSLHICPIFAALKNSAFRTVNAESEPCFSTSQRYRRTTHWFQHKNCSYLRGCRPGDVSRSNLPFVVHSYENFTRNPFLNRCLLSISIFKGEYGWRFCPANYGRCCVISMLREQQSSQWIALYSLSNQHKMKVRDVFFRKDENQVAFPWGRVRVQKDVIRNPHKLQIFHNLPSEAKQPHSFFRGRMVRYTQRGNTHHFRSFVTDTAAAA